MYLYLESEKIENGVKVPSGLMNLRGSLGKNDDPVSFGRRMAMSGLKCVYTEKPVEYKGQIMQKGVPFPEVIKHSHEPTMDKIRKVLGLGVK